MFKNLVEPVDSDDVSLSKGKWRKSYFGLCTRSMTTVHNKPARF